MRASGFMCLWLLEFLRLSRGLLLAHPDRMLGPVVPAIAPKPEEPNGKPVLTPKDQPDGSPAKLARSQGLPEDSSQTDFRDLNDEVQAQVLSFLPGWAAAKAQVAMKAWRVLLADETWWKDRCTKEFFAPQLSDGALNTVGWREKYVELLGANSSSLGTWCYRSRRHDLGDRVAQPQLFVGPNGKRLFCYGGWTNRGPQTDLLWANVDAVAASTSRPPSVQSSQEQEDLQETSNGHWRFSRAETSGTPAYRGGVQTLTPLWFGADGPSEDHIASTGAELVALAASRGSTAVTVRPGASLIMAFGGAQGGYRSEHNDWAIGVLSEGDGETPASILWGRPRTVKSVGGTPEDFRPTNRGAHTATFVPARLAGGEYPEGCVVVVGGHTDDCSTSLASIEVLRLHNWTWRPVPVEPSSGPSPRHGHSTSLVEVNGKGYLIVLGGGTGNILSFGTRERENSDGAVFDLTTWSWLGGFRVECGASVVPGRHHTASRGLNNQIYVFGGGARPGNRVCVLEGAECVAAAGTPRYVHLREVPLVAEQERPPSRPTGRKMHGAACLMPFAPLLVVFGGWETGAHFDDLWTFALGAGARQLEAFATLSQGSASAAAEASSEPEDDEDDDEDELEGVGGQQVAVSLMGPDGQIRVMRVPQRILAQLVRGGVLRQRTDGILQPLIPQERDDEAMDEGGDDDEELEGGEDSDEGDVRTSDSDLPEWADDFDHLSGGSGFRPPPR